MSHEEATRRWRTVADQTLLLISDATFPILLLASHRLPSSHWQARSRSVVLQGEGLWQPPRRRAPERSRRHPLSHTSPCQEKHHVSAAGAPTERSLLPSQAPSAFPSSALRPHRLAAGRTPKPALPLTRHQQGGRCSPQQHPQRAAFLEVGNHPRSGRKGTGLFQQVTGEWGTRTPLHTALIHWLHSPSLGQLQPASLWHGCHEDSSKPGSKQAGVRLILLQLPALL